ncbi:MAG: M23 family metallopeptidase [Treponema sp.]|jgi:murein DD-endopeptidase MepM/ murein hydrolase activator NlpD|nr:M23 family metallopeptidase [Treponema sp.]
MNYPRSICLLLLLAAIFAIGTFPVKISAEDAVHVVAKGETLYSISRLYRVSPDELMRYNDIADATKVQAGRRLRIPPAAPSIPAEGSATTTGNGVSGKARAEETTSSAQAAYTEYRVVKNDTLFSIARTNGVTVQTLRDLNKFSASYVLKEGERIKIPASATAAPARQPGSPAAPARQTTAKTVDSSVRWPVNPKEIAYMTGKLYGVIVRGERSESVRSLTQGTVISAGPYRGFGRVAIVQVSGGYLYVYGGCESLSVKEGDRIGPGTELGKLGIDAVSEKPQLFFMVYRSNTPIDPAKAPRA